MADGSGLIGNDTGSPRSVKSQGKTFFFQGQGKVSEFCFGSGKFGVLHKVREKSGKFISPCFFRNKLSFLFIFFQFQLLLIFFQLSVSDGKPDEQKNSQSHDFFRVSFFTIFSGPF